MAGGEVRLEMVSMYMGTIKIIYIRHSQHNNVINIIFTWVHIWAQKNRKTLSGHRLLPISTTEITRELPFQIKLPVKAVYLDKRPGLDSISEIK